jgi:gamma-glutamyltranspeptidase
MAISLTKEYSPPRGRKLYAPNFLQKSDTTFSTIDGQSQSTVKSSAIFTVEVIRMRGDQHLGLGILGRRQPTAGHAQFVSNIVDYGMNIKQALESPRFTKKPPAVVACRSKCVCQRLRCKGLPNWAMTSASSANIHRRWVVAKPFCTFRNETNYTASDPRADEQAIPEPIVR